MNTNNLIKKRLSLVIYVLFLLFAIVLIKLTYISLTGYYKTFSSYNFSDAKKIRRDIIDRNGNVLAINNSISFCLYSP